MPEGSVNLAATPGRFSRLLAPHLAPRQFQNFLTEVLGRAFRGRGLGVYGLGS